jgi:hypothetical protein
MFKVYKKIKSPMEWTSQLLFLENNLRINQGYTTEQLFSDVEALAQELSDKGAWKPINMSPEEQIIAMTANKRNQGDKNHNKDNKHRNKNKRGDSRAPNDADKSSGSGRANSTNKNPPPFKNSDGKIGDTKTFKGKTYYFCPAPHKESKWHLHKAEDCNTYKKWKAGGGSNNNSTPVAPNQVVVDRDKLKKGMSALFPNGDFDMDDLASSLIAALQE